MTGLANRPRRNYSRNADNPEQRSGCYDECARDMHLTCRHTRFWAVYVDGGFGNVDGVKAVGRDGKWTGGWGKGSSVAGV